MIALPNTDSSSLRVSAEFFSLRSSSGLVKTSKRLTDAWTVLQCWAVGCKGSVDMGRSRSLFCTNKGLTACVVFASKRIGKSDAKSDLDDEEVVETEADLKHTPLGFGHGKDYDLSVEEKLLEEIERDRAQREAALQKRKANSASTKNSKVKSTLNAPKTVNGIKVWLGDLPKKKNIDRDLRSAFRHVPGLLDVSPCVLGNEKTRDPICRGFGYVTFSTMDYAKSFISSFQDKTISFGKVERKLKISFMKAKESETILSEHKSVEVGRLKIRDKDAENVASSRSYSELSTFKTVGHSAPADDMQESGDTELVQPQIDVMEEEDEETAGSSTAYGEYLSEEEEDDSDDDLDMDDEPEFDISIDIEDLSSTSAISDGTKAPANKLVSDAERRIEELEERLRKKLEKGALEDESEKEGVELMGLGMKRIKASKRLRSKGNNVTAVTHGLKKREREFMTGVLEKYGKSPNSSKS